MDRRSTAKHSRDPLPIGTIRTRSRRRPGGRPHDVRFIKIKQSPPNQWIPLAKYCWESQHGPAPNGMRVCHLDGNTMNDHPSNYGLLTAGEVIALYHRLDAAMSEKNRRGTKRRAATAEHNRLRSRVIRATSWLPSRWYAVDHHSRTIINRPWRSRRKLLAEHCRQPVAMNGAISRRRLAALPIAAVRGQDLDGPEYSAYRRVDEDGRVIQRSRPTLQMLRELDQESQRA